MTNQKDSRLSLKPKLGFFFFINSPKGKGKYFLSRQYREEHECYVIKKKNYPMLPGDSCIDCSRFREIGFYSKFTKEKQTKVTGRVRYHLNVDDLKGLRDHITTLTDIFSSEEIAAYVKSFTERINYLESSSSG